MINPMISTRLNTSGVNISDTKVSIMRIKPKAKRNDQKKPTDLLKHPKLNKNFDPNLQGRVTGGLLKYYTYTYLVGEE